MQVEELHTIPAWQCGDAAVLESSVELERVRRIVDARMVELIGEADKRGLAKQQGASGTAAWLRAKQQITPGPAKTLTETAERLRETYALSAAGLGEGRGRSGARAGDRALPGPGPGTRPGVALAEGEVFLLKHARTLEPSQLASAGRGVPHRLDRGRRPKTDPTRGTRPGGARTRSAGS